MEGWNPVFWTLRQSKKSENRSDTSLSIWSREVYFLVLSHKNQFCKHFSGNTYQKWSMKLKAFHIIWMWKAKESVFNTTLGITLVLSVQKIWQERALWKGKTVTTTDCFPHPKKCEHAFVLVSMKGSAGRFWIWSAFILLKWGTSLFSESWRRTFIWLLIRKEYLMLVSHCIYLRHKE